MTQEVGVLGQPERTTQVDTAPEPRVKMQTDLCRRMKELAVPGPQLGPCIARPITIVLWRVVLGRPANLALDGGFELVLVNWSLNSRCHTDYMS